MTVGGEKEEQHDRLEDMMKEVALKGIDNSKQNRLRKVEQKIMYHEGALHELYDLRDALMKELDLYDEESEEEENHEQCEHCGTEVEE